MNRLRGMLADRALRPVLVIWAFAYLLADITVTAMGRMGPGVSTLVSIPLFVLGITFTMLLEGLRQRLRLRPRLIAWAGLGVAVLAATAIFSFADLYYFKWLSLTFVPDWQRWAVDVTPERLFTVGMLYLWTFCLVLTLLWAAGIGNVAERAKAQAALMEAGKQRAEAAALRLQLNPHFLFNTLNSISSLMTLDRKAEAEEMMEKLADFLRASLEADPMADVPLARELDTIDAYLGIEAARFGERLEIDIAVPPAAADAMVPNFILQPLVENAIKYGVATEKGRASLRISAETAAGELKLSVVNETLAGADGEASAGSPDAGAARPSTGIGLANIRQRLEMGYGDSGRLETRALDDGFEATIHLPLKLAERRKAAE
ncbi:MAG TPA: histidine kinase [Allosphingosinicella sp.]